MKKADYVVIALALALLPVLYAKFWGAGNHGDTAVISLAGQPDMTVALADNQTLNLQGPLGTSVVEVRDGRIRFVDSPCPTKQCVHTGWLEKGGDLAACLPNSISVMVASRDRHLDAINF